jgi:hypothetical protein
MLVPEMAVVRVTTPQYRDYLVDKALTYDDAITKAKVIKPPSPRSRVEIQYSGITPGN